MSSPTQIVLAEDNPVDVRLVRMALQKEGLNFHLQVFSDGTQVFDYLNEVERGTAHHPDILLLDLNMPKCSPGEILRRMRESTLWDLIPIVVVTSSDNPIDREQAAQLGVAHYFRKPCDLGEFMKLGPMIRGILISRSGSTRLT